MNALKLFKVVLPLLLLTGCWSRVEINEQLFVFALYIDKGKEPGFVEVTISSPLPNRMQSGKQAGGGGKGNPYAMVNKAGPSISETLNIIQKDMSRQLDFSHTRVVIVSREYAESGIRDILDWIVREPALNLSTFLLASTGEAKKVAELTPVFEQMPSFVLMRLEILNNILATTAKDCLLGELGGQGFALTYLNSGVKPMISEEQKNEQWTGIKGAALFHKDKMVGTMEHDETKALAWAMDHIRKPIYSVTWDGGKSKASVIFLRTNSKKEAHITNSGPLFTVKLEGTGDIILLEDSKKRSPVEVNKIIVNELKEVISTDMKNALRATQKKGADVMQFGNMLESKYPDLWEKLIVNWGEHYREEAQFEVKMKLLVRNANSSTS